MDNQIIDLYDCARDNRCPGQHKADRTCKKPLSFSDNGDGDLDLEVALGLPKDCPIQADESIAESGEDSQHGGSRISQRDPSESNVSETFFHKEGSEGLWKELYQSNWKSWELEICLIQGPYTGKSVSDLSRESLGAFAHPINPETCGEIKSQGQKVVRSLFREGIETDRDALKDRNTKIGQDLLSLKWSSATTQSRSRKSSEESWTIEDYHNILHEASNSVNKSPTLYDTVRNQF